MVKWDVQDAPLEVTSEMLPGSRGIFYSPSELMPKPDSQPCWLLFL